jgi:hypothetical protein
LDPSCKKLLSTVIFWIGKGDKKEEEEGKQERNP